MQRDGTELDSEADHSENYHFSMSSSGSSSLSSTPSLFKTPQVMHPRRRHFHSPSFRSPRSIPDSNHILFSPTPAGASHSVSPKEEIASQQSPSPDKPSGWLFRTPISALRRLFRTPGGLSERPGQQQHLENKGQADESEGKSESSTAQTDDERQRSRADPGNGHIELQPLSGKAEETEEQIFQTPVRPSPKKKTARRGHVHHPSDPIVTPMQPHPPQQNDPPPHQTPGDRGFTSLLRQDLNSPEIASQASPVQQHRQQESGAGAWDEEEKDFSPEGHYSKKDDHESQSLSSSFSEAGEGKIHILETLFLLDQLLEAHFHQQAAGMDPKEKLLKEHRNSVLASKRLLSAEDGISSAGLLGMIAEQRDDPGKLTAAEEVDRSTEAGDSGATQTEAIKKEIGVSRITADGWLEDQEGNRFFVGLTPHLRKSAPTQPEQSNSSMLKAQRGKSPDLPQDSESTGETKLGGVEDLIWPGLLQDEDEDDDPDDDPFESHPSEFEDEAERRNTNCFHRCFSCCGRVTGNIVDWGKRIYHSIFVNHHRNLVPIWTTAFSRVEAKFGSSVGESENPFHSSWIEHLVCPWPHHVPFFALHRCLVQRRISISLAGLCC